MQRRDDSRSRCATQGINAAGVAAKLPLTRTHAPGILSQSLKSGEPSMPRVHNFSAGPAVLPLEVLEQAQSELVDFRGAGMSLLEASHRGKAYAAVHEEALANLRELLAVPADYEVLLLQGGASLQFAMAPMNLLAAGQSADYVNSGAWALKAIKEARAIGGVRVAGDSADALPARMPAADALQFSPDAAYAHITSNETISGAQWKELPRPPTPLVADMSSDILSRPVNVADFGLIYAGAQKNLGPSGVTVVIIRKNLLDRAPAALPTMLRYATHAGNDSLYNTPPCYSIYILMLVTQWIKRQGVATLFERNVAKAAELYAAIDGSGGFYRGTAHPDYRSDMNITFRLADASLEAPFLAEAAEAGLKDLKGHRSVGGVRASIYNAFPVEGVRALIGFMGEFARRHG